MEDSLLQIEISYMRMWYFFKTFTIRNYKRANYLKSFKSHTIKKHNLIIAFNKLKVITLHITYIFKVNAITYLIIFDHAIVA